MLVCRRWRRICHQQNSLLLQREQDDLTRLFHEKYWARKSRRQESNENTLQRLDHELCLVLSSVIEGPRVALPDIVDGVLPEIVRLLDEGATASELDHHVRGPFRLNLGHCVDWYEEDIPAAIFPILQELVCSPCTSWRHHRYMNVDDAYRNRHISDYTLRVTEFTERLPYFILNYVLSGSAFFYCHWFFVRAPPFANRWQCWRLLQLMFLAALHSQQHQGQDKDETFHDFCLSLGRNFLSHDPCHHSATDHYFIRHFVRFILPLVAPDTFIEMVGNSSFVFLHCCFDSVLDFGRIGIHPDWVRLLHTFWGTKPMQRVLYSRVRHDHALRLILINHCLEALCRRKDRKLLELLFRQETKVMLESGIPRALNLLRRTRGKTERLIRYFTAIQMTHRQRERVLQQLVCSNSVG